MADQVHTHQTSLELLGPVPEDVEVATDIALNVGVRCASGCDLRGCSVSVMATEAVLAASALLAYDEEEEKNETSEFVVTAPEQLGDHAWNIVFPRQESGGIVHEESILPVSFRTKPVRTSVAVWDIPSPVVMGENFMIKVGAKSSGAYELTGAHVEVLDETGVPIGTGSLGEAPWPGTSALYWTEVPLAAPRREGLVAWSVRFAAVGLRLPHGEASGKFSFPIVKPPEHTLKVRVVEKDTVSPIENAHVRVGAFRCVTDGTGMASVALPKGIYNMALWKSGYAVPSRTVEMTNDMMLQVELVALPREDPDDRWM